MNLILIKFHFRLNFIHRIVSKSFCHHSSGSFASSSAYPFFLGLKKFTSIPNPGPYLSLSLIHLGSISPTFYEQLLRMQIPKAEKVTGDLTVFFHLWDLHLLKLFLIL